ncbi:HPF/RaiA family ribosome-associated protein [Chlorobium phaeobacteroides]|uniref:HPF/RaiA family ribosome-associated protein n=1 Tax=Chlorobium phaeobacteroides TaxID=1096 RepID=UPI00005356B6|nr:HPF/RaiA family ribosome-associated protein [Chlorobium phaeobacteroides]
MIILIANRNNELNQYAEAIIRDLLDRFSERITRVEIHLSDENSDNKSGIDDKRCLIEVRLVSHQPIVSTHQAATIEQAIDGAAKIMVHTLDSTISRLDKYD